MNCVLADFENICVCHFALILKTEDKLILLCMLLDEYLSLRNKVLN